MERVSEKRLQHQTSTPNKLDIQYLRSITKNFSEDQVIGRGGFGIVYKGDQGNGEVVAVKKLEMSMAVIDDKQFMNEVKNAMDICHPNIVRLQGYCYHTEKKLMFHNGSYIFVDEAYRLLCFEYLPNGSLNKYLSDESSGLDWHMRYDIINGICNGLHCLHEGRKGAPILHLDLKPANILLDKNMIPKIADFGLSRLFDDGKTHTCTKNVTGTRGYMAPEHIDRFILSKESDIYSLGVIIIEIVTGHRKYPMGTTNEEFIEVYEKWRRRLQTTSNRTSTEEESRQVNQCIEVGLKCMENDPKRRPNIREIVEILKRSDNTNSCSVTGDGFGAEELSDELVHSDWSKALNILVSYSPEQSIEAMKVICHWLKGAMDDTSWVVPEFVIKDVDKLVSDLTLMVQKSFSLLLAGASSRQCKYTLNTLMQIMQIIHLARAVNEDTLEKLVMETLLWLSNDEVDTIRELDGGPQLIKALNVLMLQVLNNTDRTFSFVILINLLRYLAPSSWPSYTPRELLAVNNKICFSDLVVKCLIKMTKDLKSTVDTLNLDRVLQSIHAFFEQLGGEEEIGRRALNGDKPLRMVRTVLHELAKLLGSKINDHLSMVPTDAEPQPIILSHIELYRQNLAADRMLASSPPGGQTQGADAATNSTNTSIHSSLDATEITNSMVEMLPEKMLHTHLEAEAERDAPKEKGSTSQPRRAQLPRTKEKGPKRWVY